MTSRRKLIIGLTTPVGMGYIPTGFAFGVLACQAGLPPILVIAMSVFIFAGALQFAAVPLLTGASDFSTVALSTLLINLRHILYAAPLLDHLPKAFVSRSYVVAALTDENYSVLTTIPEEARRDLSTAISLANHGYWVGGTTLGVLLGKQVSHWIPNLDFALPALFTILAVEQYLARRRWVPAVVGIGAYLVAKLTLPNYALIVSLGIALALLLTRSVALPSEFDRTVARGSDGNN
ncbi:AzlC family ABC transporter permease [Paraburkholderia caribensis]|uniref:AzlC family ABC transporter permease n=1 Tax=Paraburkholderia caribensis TaxID=75105 RepID=A0A9Q6SA69_9BURK|nr:AzlC family ABC transporter permease [Paraburkholderia caribensis]MCO4880571.1 AzlC family ABC transporter permease [Paraburkholderia caribensis]PTB26177.1 branched-chain amino acid permease [Paraburkholderia caribensis]QLB67313.1 branched-chain amino acid permease [Paraburkholderia caribensis]